MLLISMVMKSSFVDFKYRNNLLSFSQSCTSRYQVTYDLAACCMYDRISLFPWTNEEENDPSLSLEGEEQIQKYTH